MTKDCSLLSNIINELFTDIAKVKTTWEIIRELNPHFEPVSEDNWRGKEACFWLHGETRVMEANKLEQWLCISPPVSETAKSSAVKHYRSWCEHSLKASLSPR